MSTRIYDGIRFRSSDLLEIHGQLTAHRPVVAKAVADGTLTLATHQAVEAIDKAALAGEAIKHPLWTARHEIQEQQAEIKKAGRRDPRVDFDCTLTVMPYQGAVYGIVFCEQLAWKDAMLEAGWAEPFPYWNNTDQPDDVSDEAWEERGALWNAILAQDEWDRPVGCGFSYDFLPPPRFPGAEAALAFVPPLENRAHRQAFRLLLEAEHRRLLKAVEAEGKPADPIRIYFAAERLVRDDGYVARLDAEEERILPLLPEITAKILTDGLPAALAEGRPASSGDAP